MATQISSEQPATRTLPLPEGRRLVVRGAVESDVELLAALYERLPSLDLRYRFFASYHPPRSFFEHQTRLEEEGGGSLVAAVTGAGEQIVGHAGYVLLPDGGGEFALTVAHGWRGWLGPYLLDSLVELAASRGVPNLQADVLFENQAMLALLRGRGYVSMATGDFSVIRAAIATSAEMPFWDRGKGPPLLVDESVGGRWIGEREALQAGWRVAGCARAAGAGARQCPALAGRQCPLAACASAVIVGLPADAGKALVSAHARLHPTVPVIPLSGPDTHEVMEALASIRRSA